MHVKAKTMAFSADCDLYGVGQCDRDEHIISAGGGIFFCRDHYPGVRT